jgi:hypothetical protein
MRYVWNLFHEELKRCGSILRPFAPSGHIT